MTKPVNYTRTAIRALRKMPTNEAVRVRAKIEQYASEPAALANNVTEMRGRPGVKRLRVGNWRVLMEDGAVLAILNVGPRSSIYDD